MSVYKLEPMYIAKKNNLCEDAEIPWTLKAYS